MKTIKLNAPLLIDTVNHSAGDVVAVPDVRAAELVRLKAAVEHDDVAQVANPDHNPLADFITPEPPGGLVVNPVDGLALNVEDNPGLKKLAEVTRAKAKPNKFNPGEDPGQEKAVDANTTANELVPKVVPGGPANEVKVEPAKAPEKPADKPADVHPNPPAPAKAN